MPPLTLSFLSALSFLLTLSIFLTPSDTRDNVCRMTQDGKQKAPRWTAEQIPDQTGRVSVVTGANSGLGLATARALARRGGHVILAVRDEEKGRRAAAGITADRPGASLEVRRLDLADLDSVRAFSDALHTDHARLDTLVNNAGVMAPPRSASTQGHELQFACNHLGHFALTGLLLDLLAAEGRDPPRTRGAANSSARTARGSCAAHRPGRPSPRRPSTPRPGGDCGRCRSG